MSHQISIDDLRGYIDNQMALSVGRGTRKELICRINPVQKSQHFIVKIGDAVYSFDYLGDAVKHYNTF